MDANLVARELEMTLLAKLLEGHHVDASSNIMMPASVLLHLLRSYLGPEISMRDMEAAVEISPLLNNAAYTREIKFGDVQSDRGIRLSVFHWDKTAMSARPFQKMLREHGERPRPSLAATTFQGGPLGLTPKSFEVRNEGYGTQKDVTILGIAAPDWITAEFTGNSGTLAACPPAGGVYKGQVIIATNTNDITLPVSTESADFAFPARNELTLEELIPQHPDIDQAATEQLLDQILTGMKFERLPGGIFIRQGKEIAKQRSNNWWLSETEIRTGGLVAIGYPAKFTVYADSGGKTDKYTEEVVAEHGQLGGAGLADLFDCLDVQVGQKLSLEPYRGGYKIKLSPAEPWRMARGHTFWLQGPVNTVLEQHEVLDTLLERADNRNITVNLLLSGEPSLPEELVRQHRSGRLTIRFSQSPLPYRLIVCDEECSAFVPPFGPLQRGISLPQVIWEAASPLEGRDYRQLAWQRGKRGEDSDEWGLLDLELSVAMDKLAQALRPAANKAVHLNAQQKQHLMVNLPRQAQQLGIDKQPLLAAPILEPLKLSPEQVNASSLALRVTAGGYLVVRPQQLGGQREYARYIGNLYGGVIHHSQLRKLVEVFTGRSYESTSFVAASLYDLGWAGNGYRRPRQAWEPVSRELTPFTAEVLAHFQDRTEAIHWLRRHVAASEAQLERAISQAVPLISEKQNQQAVKRTRTVPRNERNSQPKAPKLITDRLQVITQPQIPQSVTSPEIKTQVIFAPLIKSDVALPDPRFMPFSAVHQAVKQLIEAEGPLPEVWLIRRYAKQIRCNPRQIQALLLEALNHCVNRGEAKQERYPCGHIEYLVEGQQATLRERGERCAEDIPFGEWCALLQALGLATTECNDAQAYKQATRAFKFGNDARRVSQLLALALQTVRKKIA